MLFGLCRRPEVVGVEGDPRCFRCSEPRRFSGCLGAVLWEKVEGATVLSRGSSCEMAYCSRVPIAAETVEDADWERQATAWQLACMRALVNEMHVILHRALFKCSRWPLV